MTQGAAPKDGGSLDHAQVRGLVVDGNHGIMATAGIVEGLNGVATLRA